MKFSWYGLTFALLCSVLIGIGLSAIVNYTLVAMPKAESWESIPLPHLDNITIQQKGSNVLVKDAFINEIAYTGSMKPTIYGGNKMLLRPYSYYKIPQQGNCPDLKEGQIAVYVEKELTSMSVKYVVHRIIDNQLGDGIIRFKGDNNRASEFVECEQIKYTVVGVIFT